MTRPIVTKRPSSGAYCTPQVSARTYIRMHVRMYRCVPIPYLGNGWTDYAEVWYGARDPLIRHFTEAGEGLRGTVARANVRTPFPYLENGWTDCAEICCVVMGPTAICFIGYTSGAH